MTGYKPILLPLLAVLIRVLTTNPAVTAEECPESPADPSMPASFSQREYQCSQPIGTILKCSMTVFIEAMESLTDLQCLLGLESSGNLVLNEITLDLNLNDYSFTAGIGSRAVSVGDPFVLNSSEYEQCTRGNKTYYTFPLIMTVQHPQSFGKRLWELQFEMNSELTMSRVLVTTLSNTTFCPEDKFYIFSTEACVNQCPCNMKTFPYFCYKINPIDFNVAVAKSELSTNTSSDDIVYTISVLVNESLIDEHNLRMALSLHNLGLQPTLMPRKQYPEYILNFPAEYMVAGGTASINISPIVFGDKRSLIDNCTTNEGNYLQLSLHVILKSPFLYHLGMQLLELHGMTVNSDHDLPQINAAIQLSVQNTDNPCTPEKPVLDFPTRECVAVNNCSCGYVPNFAGEPYCKPVNYEIIRPTNFGEESVKMSVPVSTVVFKIIRIYVSDEYEIFHKTPSMEVNSTSTISMELSLNGDQTDDSTSLQFSIANEDALNRKIPLNNATFDNQKSCIAGHLSPSQQNFLLLNITISTGSTPGLSSKNLTVRYSSSDPTVEADLHHPGRELANEVLINSMTLEINVKRSEVTPTETAMMRPTPTETSMLSPSPTAGSSQQAAWAIMTSLFTAAAIFTITFE